MRENKTMITDPPKYAFIGTIIVVSIYVIVIVGTAYLILTLVHNLSRWKLSREKRLVFSIMVFLAIVLFVYFFGTPNPF